MTPEAAAWWGQVPWVPLGVLAVLVLAGWVLSRRGQSRRNTLAAVLASGAQVIDVRSKGEFAGGHYPGAVNLPVDTLESQTKRLGPKDKPLVVYCASGGRSARAAAVLRRAGYTQVTDAGGLANLPH